MTSAEILKADCVLKYAQFCVRFGLDPTNVAIKVAYYEGFLDGVVAGARAAVEHDDVGG